MQNSRFDWIIMGVVIISSIQLAIDSPLSDPNTNFSFALLLTDYFLTAIFAMEATLKIIANGLLFTGDRAYLKNTTNIFDLAIVIITVMSYFFTQNLNAIKVFKLIKVLRPLRAISRNQGLKVSISSLSLALPSIVDIVVVIILFLFVFGIISINYFKG